MGSRRRFVRSESELIRKATSLRGVIHLRANAGDRSAASRSRRRALVFETLGQRRVLAVITGTIFNDADGSMRAEPSEQRLESRLAFLDANDNGSLDAGEAYQLTDQNGNYQFDGVESGIHPVRLFGNSQTQTFPVAGASRQLASQLDLSEAVDAGLAGETLHIATSRSLVFLRTTGTSAQVQSLPFSASKVVLPIGIAAGQAATVMLGDTGGQTPDPSGLWLVHSNDQTPELLFSGTSIDAAVGDDGYGIVVDYQENESLIHSLQVSPSNPDDLTPPVAVSISSEAFSVPAGAQVLAASTAFDTSETSTNGDVELASSRTVVAWPVAATVDDGNEVPALHTSIWNNRSAGWIEGSETVIAGASELLSFDDKAGLLAIRDVHGDVLVLDVDANFAELQRFEELPGRVDLVQGRDALLSATPDADGHRLKLQDLNTANTLATFELGTTAPQKLIAGQTTGAFFVLSTSGLSKIAFQQRDAHRINVTEENQTYQADFGVIASTDNTTPEVQQTYTANAVEDETLSIPATALMQWVTDQDGDRVVPLVAQPPTHGSIEITDDGSLNYTPEENYNGTDTFSLQFHDGVALSSPIAITVDIESRPDPPTGISFFGDAIPEHTVGPYVVGGISIDDVDFDSEYQLAVYDDRFIIENGNLVLVKGPLNYEIEEVIHLAIAGMDRRTGYYFTQDLDIQVADENDPVTQLLVGGSSVEEKVKGAYIAHLSSFDEDRFQPTTYSVSDNRFEIRNDNELWLKPDESLDFDREPFVVMTVKADDNHGSSMSKEFRLNVRDQPDYGGSITLTNHTVVELETGAVVGDVSLNNVSRPSVYHISVNDARFEVDGSTLKLLDHVSVRRSAAEQIELTLTAIPSEGDYSSVSKSFIIEVLENASPFHNDVNPYDVDSNGTVSPLDALVIINLLGIYGPGPVGPGNPGFGYDVNGDGQVTTLDALLVINILNTLQNGGTVGGEANPDDDSPTNSQSNTTPLPDPSTANNDTSANRDFSASTLTQLNSLETDSDGDSAPPLSSNPNFWCSATSDLKDLPVDHAQRATDWLLDLRDGDPDLDRAIDELLVDLQDALDQKA
ncbi:dockerin type I domain-containing protein [Rhodopirellula sp. MGV]|uniref:dockerin type I domain-containing protein n=1 Tax=Rhodopirellula sp. MGV TaxID=2023130 RepID=UPI000B95D1F7|nr:dockerin type I domain-containing protein [Rhodopirellula sp. MGV]OYP35160.1 hypothetical protein CGZ80_12220 [Rhodopirellula sp. MGV]PNY37824.1 hypothetical protein C2E31_06080 [Rhodopirellula baltica]